LQHSVKGFSTQGPLSMTDCIQQTKDQSVRVYEQIAGKIPSALSQDIHMVFAQLHGYLTPEQLAFVNKYFEHIGLGQIRGTVVRIRTGDEYMIASGAAAGTSGGFL